MASKLAAYGIGMSTPVTLLTGASKYRTHLRSRTRQFQNRRHIEASLLDDDTAGFLGRRKTLSNGQGAEVDDFCFDAIFFEFFSGFQAITNHFGRQLR